MNRAIITLALLAGVAACGILSPDDDYRWAELAAARSLWETRGFDSYEYLYRRQVGEGLPEWQRLFRVRVEDGVVVSILDAATGDDPPSGFTAPTVPGLFDVAEDALERADSVVVEYHAELGYPTLISVDYHLDIADDEVAITAAELAPI